MTFTVRRGFGAPSSFTRRFSIAGFLLVLSAPAFSTNLPPFLIAWPDSVPDILVAETETSTLHRLTRHEDGSISRSEGYMSIGQNGVRKQREWDRRTPLGVYFITEQLDTRHLHEKYGITAFPLDYPNARDEQLGRTGDGIWLHGVTPGNGRRPPRDTDGCIALPNEDLAALAVDLIPQVTPIIVTRKLSPNEMNIRAELLQEFRAALDNWADAIRRGNLRDYLGYYAEDFAWQGVGREEWAVLRYAELSDESITNVEMSDLFLARDPEDNGIYVSRFVQTMEFEDRAISRTKRLYWQRSNSGELKIVAEDDV